MQSGTLTLGTRLLPFLTLITAGATSAHAGWSVVDHHVLPDVPPVDSDSCTYSSAFASAFSTPDLFGGLCEAYDNTLFCEMNVANTATDVEVQVWSYTPVGQEPDIGQLEVSCYLEIDGEVEITTAHSAAAAVGWANFSSNIGIDKTIICDDSAGGTTLTPILGLELIISSLTITLPINGVEGEGPYPDDDVAADVARKCGNFFRMSRKAQVKTSAYAEAAALQLTPGYCEGEITGHIEFTVTELVCPPPLE